MSPTTAAPPGRVEIVDSVISSSSHPPPAELGDSTDINSDGYTTSNPSKAESFLGIVDSPLPVTPTLSSDSTSSTLIELGGITDINTDEYTISNPPEAESPESSLEIVDFSSRVIPRLSTFSTSSTLVELGDGTSAEINCDGYTIPNPSQSEPQKSPPSGSNQLLKANKMSTPKPSAPAAESSASKPLTAKELKEKKKAEKAARRAQTKGDVGVPQKSQQQQAPKVDQKDSNAVKGQSQQKGKKGTPEGIVKTIYVSETPPSASKKIAKETGGVEEAPKDLGIVGLLKDLEVEQNEKKKKAIFGIDNAHSDVHPAILSLGMQINKHILVGSAARCLGFLLAMQRVIEDYETPKGATLNRHLPGHYLSHQVNYLLSARPMSIAMGNTIRWLKTEISKVSPDLTQEAAKKALSLQIGAFIHEKLTAADEMIVRTTVDRYINDDDVIVTYGKSQVIEKTLIEAYRRGKQFRVIIVDDRPLYEGKHMLQALVDVGIECTYINLYTLDDIIEEATIVLLGAHGVLSNGSLYSRSGTAITAMCAAENQKEVIVCCESIKFTDKIFLDAVVCNEIGDADLLTPISVQKRDPGPLQGWREKENTHAANFRYDITPAHCIKTVVCEHGSLNPASVQFLTRISAET
ncbi:hypothetical protein RUND412_002546 [Rhizina undulata]